MDDLTEYLREALESCIERGMQPPFILCAASPNGSVICIRASGGEPEILAEHYDESNMFRAPITIMVLDQTGEAVRISIKAGRLTFH
jgi:plastocyanin domain-containing protein